MNKEIEIGNRIKLCREKAGLTQEELGLSLGLNKSTIQRYEAGKITRIKLPVLEAIANELNINPEYLVLKTEDPSIQNKTSPQLLPLPEMKKVPLLGAIACGEPVYKEEHEWVSLPSDIKADFCLRCEGDSMINARIYDGDIVFIRSCPEVENGQIAAVSINNEVTLKRVYYYPDKNKLVLNPENTSYEPFVYVNEELDDVRILGRAVMFLSNVK